MGVHLQAVAHGPCRDRSLVQWLLLWTWVEDSCIGCLPMVAWWHFSQHILGSQTGIWTIILPNIFESIGFGSCADCNPLQDLSCKVLRGHQADLLMFPHDAVCLPSLQISLKPWILNWKASIRSKASKVFSCWTNRNWLRENLYDAVRILQMNADYENQGILPRTCTCDSIKVWGKGKRSYAFSEDFEDKSV